MSEKRDIEETLLSTINTLRDLCLMTSSTEIIEDVEKTDKLYKGLLTELMSNYQAIRHHERHEYDYKIPPEVIECVDMNQNPQAVYIRQLEEAFQNRVKETKEKKKEMSLFEQMLREELESSEMKDE